MNQALALPSPDEVMYPRAEPRLQLLVEWEPRYRIFFRNLADFVWPRMEPPLFLASPPVVLRRPLYVRTGVRWRVVVESTAWHLALAPLLLILWTLSLEWQHEPYPVRYSMTAINYAPLNHDSRLESFPAREGRQGKPLRPTHEAKAGAKAGGPIIHLKPERRQATVSPPSVRLGKGAPGAIPSWKQAWKQEHPAAPVLATAPAPTLLDQRSQRTFSSPRALVVAPAPAAASGARSARGAPPSAVIAPAPALQSSAAGRAIGDIDIGPSVVVAPSPRLTVTVNEQRAGPETVNGSLHSDAGIVPPPPSFNSGVSLAGESGNSVAGVHIVPPPPSLAGPSSGDSTLGNSSIRAAGGGNSATDTGATGAGVRVVPPPPAIAGSDVLGGSRGGSFGAGGDGRALPAPGLASAGKGTAASGGDTLSGSGSGGSASVAPSVGANPGAGESIASTAGSGPASGGAGSNPVAGNPAQPGQKPAPMVRAAIPRPAEVVDVPGGTTRVLPLRVIQLALALPRSSYFSNYEAFVAERSINEHVTQLIKLVYIFLPYQRGLTEYGVNTSKTFRLRVTRDPSCDESLINMTWPESEPESQSAIAESSKDKLPCYRTTADDYRKALQRAR